METPDAPVLRRVPHLPAPLRIDRGLWDRAIPAHTHGRPDAMVISADSASAGSTTARWTHQPASIAMGR